MTAVYIFLGGGLGSIARYGVSKFVLNLAETHLPLGTLLANILSCIVLGFILTTNKITWMDSDVLKPLMVIGFCGGFSTFSTFSLETLALLRNDMIFWAVANILVSIAMCMFILYLLIK